MGRKLSPVSWDSPREATEEEVAVNHGLRKQIMAASAVSLAAFSSALRAASYEIDLSLGLTSGANIASGHWDIYRIMESHVISILASLVMGFVATCYGRKPTLMLAAAVNIIGTVILRNQYDRWSHLLGSAFSSFSIIAGLIVAPMLLSEIVHRKARGALVAFCTVYFNLGLIVAFAIFHVESNVRAALYCAVSATQLILLIFIPESPYFLVSKSRTLEAEGSVFWSRGSNRSIAKGELAMLVRSPVYTENHRTLFQTLMTEPVIRAFIISVGLVFFQRVAGFLVFYCYSNYIFDDVENFLSYELSGFILVGTIIFASLLSMGLVDTVGRKPLLYISYGGNFLSLLAMTVYSSYFEISYGQMDRDKSNLIPFLFFMCFTISNNVGAVPLMSLIPNEVSPIKFKSVIAAFDAILTSLLVLGVVSLTRVLKNHFGDYTNFSIPTIMNLIAVLFVWAFVPETKREPLLGYFKEKFKRCDSLKTVDLLRCEIKD